MSKNSNSSSGTSFVGLLTILFIGLKLTGYVTWSWVWVLSPVWLSVSFGMLIFAAIIVYAVHKELTGV